MLHCCQAPTQNTRPAKRKNIFIGKNSEAKKYWHAVYASVEIFTEFFQYF
jgi:hypothetical protein